MFSLIRSLEDVAKTKIMNCDGEIITFLLENGPSRPSEIISNSRHSHVQVFNKLKELLASGLLDRFDGSESKLRLYKLNDDLFLNIKARLLSETKIPL